MTTISLTKPTTTEPAVPMTLNRLIRWSGLANIAMGICFALETLLHPERNISNAVVMIQQTVLRVPWNVVHTLAILAFVLGLFGLLGLYLRQFEQLGRLGFGGFVLNFIGLALGIGVVVPDAYLFPVLAGHPSTLWLLDVPGPLLPAGEFGLYTILSGVSLVIGTVLFSLASIRARRLPVWGFWLLGVGVPLVTFGPLVDNNLGLLGAVLGGWGYLWLGWALWADKNNEKVTV